MRKIRRAPFTKTEVENVGEVCLFPAYIAGEYWQYGLVTAEQMAGLSEGRGSVPALCDGQAQAIYVQTGDVSHVNVIHELGHAYMSMNCVHSASLSSDQVEEVMCDIMAYNWCRILLQARIMVHNLACLEDYLGGQKDQDWLPWPDDVLSKKLPEHLTDLVATYVGDGGQNTLLKACVGKRKPR